MRWHKPWKAADGLFIEEIGSDALTPYRLTARAWSPSVLQQYARCPYRFALRGIFGLRPAERPGGIQRMDPATRGEIYHAVQFELLRDLAERAATGHGGNLPAALERLDAVLHEVAEAPRPIWPRQSRRSGAAEMQGLRADLRGWLQQKRDSEADWTPEFFELSFGLRGSGRPRSAQPQRSRGHRGRRLSCRAPSTWWSAIRSGMLRVVDHKTGRVPEPRPELVGGGEVLQPALYALAAEKMLGEPVALWAALLFHHRAELHDRRCAAERVDAAGAPQQVLAVIDEAIRDGFLPAAPRKDGCKHCEYLPVCGPVRGRAGGGKIAGRVEGA